MQMVFMGGASCVALVPVAGAAHIGISWAGPGVYGRNGPEQCASQGFPNAAARRRADRRWTTRTGACCRSRRTRRGRSRRTRRG